MVPRRSRAAAPSRPPRGRGHRHGANARQQCQHAGRETAEVYAPPERLAEIRGLMEGWLAGEGIESISLNPDTVIDTWQKLADKFNKK